MRKLRRFLRSTFSRTTAAASAPPPAWSIGILAGKDPLSLAERADAPNPAFRHHDVTDRRVSMVADPFLHPHGGRWYLFYEMLDLDLGRGVISWAASDDTRRWEYGGLALEEPFHLSYPYVFAHGGSIWMIPETKEAREIRLYEAVEFPRRWRLRKALLQGKFRDSSIVHYEDRWWLFVADGAYSLAIFHADDLLGEWRRHSKRIIYRHDKLRGRPGGRVICHEGKLIRFAQDARGGYGHQLGAFMIDTLTPRTFAEHALPGQPILAPGGSGWRAVGMHHLDAHLLSDGSWIAAVDGAGYPNAADEAGDASAAAATRTA